MLFDHKIKSSKFNLPQNHSLQNIYGIMDKGTTSILLVPNITAYWQTCTFKMNLLSILFTLWARRCSHRVLDWTSTTGDFGTLGTGTCPPAPHPLHCTPRPCSNVASPPIQTGSVRKTESISLIQQKKKTPNFPISVLLKQHPWHIFFENVSSNLKKNQIEYFHWNNKISNTEGF